MLNRILRFFEKDRFNYAFIYLVVGIFAEIRHILEGYLPSISLHQIISAGFASRCYIIAFFWLAFFMGTTIVSAIADIPLINVSNLFLWGYWIIITVPLFDMYIFHHPLIYGYAHASRFFYNLIMFYHNEWGVTPGMILELAIVFLLIFSYTKIRTKSTLKALAATIIVYVLTTLIGTPSLLVPFAWPITHLSNVKGELFYALLFNLTCVPFLFFTKDGRALAAKGIRSVSWLSMLVVVSSLAGEVFYSFMTTQSFIIRPISMSVLAVLFISLIPDNRNDKELFYIYLLLSIWFIATTPLMSMVLLVIMLVIALSVSTWLVYMLPVYALCVGYFAQGNPYKSIYYYISALSHMHLL